MDGMVLHRIASDGIFLDRLYFLDRYKGSYMACNLAHISSTLSGTEDTEINQ